MIDLPTRAQLVTLYSEPQRHYHTLEHVHRCLRILEHYSDLDDPKVRAFTSKFRQGAWLVIEYAIWFHDCVYDPGSVHGKNESQSAIIAHSSLRNYPENVGFRVSNAIELTIDHFDHTNILPEEQLFLDIDLSILGAPREEYKVYMKNIQKEYLPYCTLEQYKTGRKKFLEKMLALPHLFYTDYFREQYENIAISNIQYELAQLSYDNEQP